MTEALPATLALAAALGAASSLHCVGMCGGFSLLVGGRAGAADGGAGRLRRGAALAALLRFHAGRLCSYAFLGALSGAFAGRLADLGVPRRGFAWIAGGALVALALHQLGVPLLRMPRGTVGRPLAALAGLLRRLAASGDGVSLLLFGAANGLLPCAATAAALAIGAAAGGALAASAVMVAFGLATAPALLLLGAAGAGLSRVARLRLARVAAVTLLLAGAVTLWRAGLGPLVPNCCAR